MVTWEDISKDVEDLRGGYQFIGASGFNMRSSEFKSKFAGMTMADYMRWLWNNPQAGQSPYKMFEGIVSPDGEDEDGNIIYKYNGKD